MRRLIGWNLSEKELLAQPGLEDSCTGQGQSLQEIEFGNRQWTSTLSLQRIWRAGRADIAIAEPFAPA